MHLFTLHNQRRRGVKADCSFWLNSFCLNSFLPALQQGLSRSKLLLRTPGAHLRDACRQSVTGLSPATENSHFHPEGGRLPGVHCTSARSPGRTNSSRGTAMGTYSWLEVQVMKEVRFLLALQRGCRRRLGSSGSSGHTDC